MRKMLVFSQILITLSKAYPFPICVLFFSYHKINPSSNINIKLPTLLQKCYQKIFESFEFNRYFVGGT